MPIELSKYKDTYIREAGMHLKAMNQSLLILEKKSSKTELNKIFSEVHTLKSVSAAMKYAKTAMLCHSIENVLDAVKKKKIGMEKCIDPLFESFDFISSSIKEIRDKDVELDSSATREKLEALILKDSASGSGKKEATEDSEPSQTREIEKVSTIDVKVERLDLLMNLVEELLITKMRFDRHAEELQNSALSATVNLLERLVADVQFNVMQVRMVPIGFVFNRFPRMVRDLAKEEGKDVNLEMEGMDIELDRSVIDEIGESLVHLLRNAVGHGIETPEERKKSDKPAQGTVQLTAKRTKTLAVIEISDDGRGLDLEEIKKSGIKKGILNAQSTSDEIVKSIFSEVSTTQRVTEVSGRGFGLNIAKSKIESLGGAIRVASEPGKGTKFIIEIPLTLTIIKVLFVSVQNHLYAIPVINVSRLVTVDRQDIKGMLNYEAIVLDDEDIPITRLNELFRIQSNPLDKQPIVIIKKGEEKLGLAVDGFLSTQEIVVKPLHKLLRDNKYFSGSTIIGSGETVLILDITNLIISKREQIKSKTNGSEKVGEIIQK